MLAAAAAAAEEFKLALFLLEFEVVVDGEWDDDVLVVFDLSSWPKFAVAEARLLANKAARSTPEFPSFLVPD